MKILQNNTFLQLLDILQTHPGPCLLMMLSPVQATTMVWSGCFVENVYGNVEVDLILRKIRNDVAYGLYALKDNMCTHADNVYRPDGHDSSCVSSFNHPPRRTP